mmetsp:Transcript_5178/g.11247  ORF Transcript_5178/g.11247 Transcript_5178/m.11247 type:complete len:293 (-) Transcript_5178:195-1073(-)|eukprot:CAMPEP_0172576064 /NCGR_PEP_ID=MMETSP1067-20121228/137533_1 /TAXON_ID=265564 ORGANISM="Thalassiosira punctigera, Strain Tpunct2005C2" /NCGR_SAMPLE_ID=MMETSP1067 /ASSEMBLY_ACC=CAM_ASM_000444 /LENGTH=292 /DNA_ID=CAMNT_0013368725 /DNA_START=70 /DNA_END=951 /DNA_ORIENTATION=-
MLEDVLLNASKWAWRPQIATSKDGKPLATDVGDLFLGFPYDRLPLTSSPLESASAFLLRPEVCFSLCLAYYTSKPLLRKIARAVGLDPASAPFRAAVAGHNLLLAAFSAVCFVNSWPIVLGHLFSHGWESVYCDQDGRLWNDGLGGWIIIFYWSKYYEFMDTWVLIFKGKQPSFLQVYHHIGIVLFMRACVASQSTLLLIVLLLNSGIHTLMYTYFFVKTICPKVEIKAAKNLTTAQIVQFFVGILYTLPIHALGERCYSRASRFAVACIQLYVVGLIFLFVAFASKKYKKG